MERISIEICNKPKLNIRSEIFSITNKLDVVNLKIVKCDFEHINDIFLNKFDNLENLDLHANKINHLPNGIFSSLVHLSIIDLSFNSINHIDDYFFTENIRLSSINLSNNKLKEINDTAIKNLFHLETFDLSYNRIAKLQDTFLDNDNLRCLKLGNNSISAISDFAFVKLPNLHVLKLDHNKITEINSLVFSKLPMLICLLLNGNCISHVSMNAFTMMTKLKVLQLRDNCIKVINNNFLKNIDLESLDLGNNRTKSVKSDIFQCNKELKNLSLTILRHFDVRAISKLEHLVTFDLLHESDEKFVISIKLITILLTMKNLTILRIVYKYGDRANEIDRFRALKNLRKLDIECLKADKTLKKINIVKKFNCISKLRTLTFRNLNLICDPVPKEANIIKMAALKYLDLTGIKNTHVSQLFTHFPCLESLNLSHSELKFVDPNVFMYLLHLKFLHLEYSKLDRIYPALFRNNYNLKGINLSHCCIMSIEDYSFMPLISLKLIDLRHSVVSNVSSKAYSRLNKGAHVLYESR